MSRANDMVYPLDHSVNIAPNGTIQCGLTIREHFAAMFTQAVIAKNPPCGEYHADMSECDKPASYARAGVMYADALIAELSKAQP